MDEVGYVGSQASKYQLKSCENIPTKFFLFSALANQNDSDSGFASSVTAETVDAGGAGR